MKRRGDGTTGEDVSICFHPSEASGAETGRRTQEDDKSKRHDSRNLSRTRHIHLLPSIHLPPQRTASRIHHPPQPIRSSQRLQRLQPMPRIHPDMIFPEILHLPVETILLGYHQRCDCLPGVFLRIPDFAGIFDGLFGEVFEKLELEEIFGVMVVVEGLQPAGKDVGGIGAGFYGFFVEFLLGDAVGYEAVFGNVVAEAEGGLAVLAGAFDVGIADGITEFLQLGVWTGFEVFVEVGLVGAVFDAEVNDFAGGFGVGEIEGGGAVEFDVLCGNSGTAGE